MHNYIWIIRTITFLSAFLLFQIELIIGKVFLPNFGGSYLVWGACVVFFQAVMLFGYKYSQVIGERVGIDRYRKYHCILALLPLLVFPGRSLPMNYQIHSIPMVLDIFLHLSIVIGLVFFVLSTTSIIWQMWLGSSNLKESKNPYALFAVSNMGSFVALLSYPFYFELFFDLNVQQNIWRILYLVFVGLQWLAFRLIPVKPSRVKQKSIKRVDPKKAVGILLYSAAGVMMFLSSTNIVTAEIAPIPLLWVIPLTIYLLSFVLNFKRKPYCPRWIISEFNLISGLGILYFFIVKMNLFPVAIDAIFLFGLTFLVCMFAQYKIYNQRPSNKQAMGSYYYLISLGGFLGGIVVTWIVPLLSTTYVEYFLAYLAILTALWLDSKCKYNFRSYAFVLAILAVLYFAPMLILKLKLIAVLFVVVICMVLFSYLGKNPRAMVVCVLVCMILVNVFESRWDKSNYIYRHRNYYGISKVLEQEGVRVFWHGTTIHGAQFLDHEKSKEPLMYYGTQSPVGEVLGSRAFDIKHIGILGLGVGTLTTYLQNHQTMDFFELEDDVLEMAREYFTYLKGYTNQLRFFVGDGRLNLQEISDHRYDLFVNDAYSGDSIPVHLLTLEALSTYQQKLSADGIMLFHVSNRYIDVAPVLFRIAAELGLQVGYKHGEPQGPHTEYSTWVAITSNQDTFEKLVEELQWNRLKDDYSQLRIWTDAYSSVLPFVKYNELLMHSKYTLQYQDKNEQIQ